MSVHSTPALSPMASPRHSHSSVGRDSSSSRFSRKDKVGRKGVPPGKGWQEIGVIEEEGLLDDDDQRRGMPKRCKYFLIFVTGFAVLFFFALVLWGASRSQKLQIAGADGHGDHQLDGEVHLPQHRHLLWHPRHRRPLPALLLAAQPRLQRQIHEQGPLFIFGSCTYI